MVYRRSLLSGWRWIIMFCTLGLNNLNFVHSWDITLFPKYSLSISEFFNSNINTKFDVKVKK
jgi:hypothetical protein